MPSSVETARALLASGEIDVIVSDLDGVLRRFDPGLWDELDRDLGAPRGTAHQAILGSPLLTEVTHGRATHAQWRGRATEDLRARGFDSLSARAAVDRWASSPATVDPDVADLLREAQGHDVPVFVFTNGTDRVPEEMAAIGLDEFAGPHGDHLLNSIDLGSTKPHRAAFAAAHRRIERALAREVPVGRVLFLDDTDGHVDGARAFGWRALVHRH